MENKKVSIIGLGLIGGSLAKALHERLGITDITAVNRSVESINQAVKDRCISRGFSEINEYVLDSDIIFICTPVKNTLAYLNMLAGNVKPGCIITDVGSTKGEIIKFVNSMPSPPCFIGGHPMAGTEKTGYSAGFSHLFENAYYILTPAKSATSAAVECLEELIKGIGGIPVILDAEEHDKITGSVSHVPHVIASALVNMVKNSDSPDCKMQMLAAGGFKDITRIASSSPEIWESIVLSNKEKIGEILDDFIEMLHSFKDLMESGNSSQIYEFFEQARAYRSLFPSVSKGLLVPVFEIIVDVVDKPGIIGRIASILGNNNINIKNINVSNSREFEQGCLIITLPDAESANIAFDLLGNSGYKVYKSS